MAFHHVEDGGLAVLELVRYFFELLNLLDGVGEVLGENFGLAFVDGGFGRGGTGVDYQRVLLVTHNYMYIIIIFKDNSSLNTKHSSLNTHH